MATIWYPFHLSTARSLFRQRGTALSRSFRRSLRAATTKRKVSQGISTPRLERRNSLYVLESIVSGRSGIATSNRAWMESRTFWSSSVETKVMARPLVPNRPARLEDRRSDVSQHPSALMKRKHAHSPDAVQVRIGISRGVVVDDDCRREREQAFPVSIRPGDLQTDWCGTHY